MSFCNRICDSREYTSGLSAKASPLIFAWLKNKYLSSRRLYKRQSKTTGHDVDLTADLGVKSNAKLTRFLSATGLSVHSYPESNFCVVKYTISVLWPRNTSIKQLVQAG